MFDLETAIRQWKKTLAGNPGLEEGQRAELEAGLRDEVSDLINQGLCPEEAFRQVSTGMGSADEIGLEFFKVYANHRFTSPSWKPPSFTPALLWNYVIITLRKIKRQKGYSIINTAGLAVGLACCALMLLWIRDERSFDRFHSNRDSIHRLIKVTRTGEKTTFDARTPYPLGEAILETVPEVVNFIHYQGVFGGWEMTFGEKTFFNDNIGTADAAFFEMFSFPFVQGDPKTALADRDSIVVTESMANKYFGTEEPLGKVLTISGRHAFTVTGVIKDIPPNSHLQFDCIVPSVNFWQWWEGESSGWNMIMFYTYVQLAPHSSAASAGAKIAAVLNQNVPNSKADILVQPLKDVHLKSKFEWDLDNYAQGSQSTLMIFTLAALGILLLAMINFTNLSTARSANRAKEVGLRKVSGAKRADVIGQFLGESVVLAFLSLFLALFLVFAVLPLFNGLAGKNIVFSSLFRPQLILTLLGVTLLTGLLSGSYPSFFLSAFQPIHVLKDGGLSGGRRQAALRKSLVVVQFALTLFLVMGTTVVNRQLNFVRKKNIGIDTHNILILSEGGHLDPSSKSIFLSNPNVLSVTLSDPPQLDQRGTSDVFWEGKIPENDIQFFPVIADADYLQTFHIGMAEGRFYSREFPSDLTDSLVINETAARAMGMTSPVDKRVRVRGHEYTVIGVIRDFHQSSLHRPIEPMIISYSNEHYFYCIRLRPTNTKKTIAFLEATWKKFVPQRPFTYEFLDDRIDGFYSSERKVQSVLGLFTGIALFTACLGLFGLASFLAEKRTKEIGLRKILGAPVMGLIWHETWEFSKWVVFSGLVAGPAAYYAAGRWLRGFAYHFTPGIGIFLTAMLATLLVALLAVGFQSVRAAKVNPVESLRHE